MFFFYQDRRRFLLLINYTLAMFFRRFVVLKKTVCLCIQARHDLLLLSFFAGFLGEQDSVDVW